MRPDAVRKTGAPGGVLRFDAAIPLVWAGAHEVRECGRRSGVKVSVGLQVGRYARTGDAGGGLFDVEHRVLRAQS